MNPKYMLDTNICIYLMKHQPPMVRERFSKCFIGDVVISAITQAELQFGVECSNENRTQNQAVLCRFLEEILVVPFDSDAAIAYGPIRAVNRERSKGALDRLIASHAIALGVTLVTNNEADFVGYPGISIENWIQNH